MVNTLKLLQSYAKSSSNVWLASQLEILEYEIETEIDSLEYEIQNAPKQ